MSHIQDRRADGRGWVLRWTDPNGRSHTKSFIRERDAKAFMATLEHSKIMGDYVSPDGGKVLFAVRYDRWFDTTVNVRPSTRARDESYARSLILPTFGSRRLASIDHDAVQAWVASLIAAGKAPATVIKAHQILSKVLTSAVKARVIARNPCDETELPKLEREEQLFLTPVQVARLADAIDPAARPMVLLGAYAGLRVGELFGLRVRRVDTLHSTVEVAEIVVEVKGTARFGPPKTKASRRVVPVPRSVSDELIPLLAGREPDALVFSDGRGGPLRGNNFRRRVWQPGTVAAGLGEMVAGNDRTRQRYEGLRVHDLRHTAVAFWIAARASPTEIARRAGHTSVVTVLDRYGHLLPKDEDTVTDVLDKMARLAAEELANEDPPADVTRLHRKPST